MAEKNAQEQYEALRAQLKDIGQHGVLWALDKTVQALRAEHRAETQVALDKQLAEVPVAPFEPIDVPVIITPQAGAAGEGGGASSAAGSDDKAPLLGGVIA